MTEKELSKYYWLRKEIKDLEERLAEFGYGVSATKLDKEISRITSTESIQEKRVIIIEKWISARVSALEEYLKIESYIESVEDSEIRQIMRYRFLDLKKWNEIDKLMICGKDYAKKKYYQYRKK
ncbi:MAG: hypothetical protein IKE89_02300 [Bacilli bacterium]|nr:hypothetical protein [Bacilli bacterium]